MMKNVKNLNKAITRENAIFESQHHSFHILGPSALPALTAFFLFSFLLPTAFYLHGWSFGGFLRSDLMHIGFAGLFYTVLYWFFSIVQESAYGFHTRKVQQGLRLGVLLFILSEVMLFFAFFWSFFHLSLVPSIAIGAIWPPTGTQELNAWGIPLVNTLLLLSSGVTVTIAHAYLVKNNHDGFFNYLFLTIVLGIVFLVCQGYEYKYGIKFSWRDNIYGSIFFLTTGFHGLHVTIGTMMLLFCWIRQLFTNAIPNDISNGDTSLIATLAAKLDYNPKTARLYAFTASHHFGFEATAWYWHFVDVVWLFLFITVYWWGGY